MVCTNRPAKHYLRVQKLAKYGELVLNDTDQQIFYENLTYRDRTSANLDQLSIQHILVDKWENLVEEVAQEAAALEHSHLLSQDEDFGGRDDRSRSQD